jgi:hypothetical protein
LERASSILDLGSAATPSLSPGLSINGRN